ncbi:hypothetical protein OZX69_00145 [Lactobacillus sp. ESL0731]|uniref:hypothetical protein n=1 Tax=unclassified Lactobacillus TaxID=2620435 RepID=UPI0023F9BF8C|nr:MULTISPECIES: hypothetical protein [unclassified Lactobacillus]WEV51174.1 hypothetical protein OZX63_00145 [Lactobacillus sp. ESL0700]WEV62304.1 hypothetical protein OZX69_00145 [Lactobacillus sp. ESL0731]
MDTVIALGSIIAVIILVLVTVVRQLNLLITEIAKLINALSELKAAWKKFRAK